MSDLQGNSAHCNPSFELLNDSVDDFPQGDLAFIASFCLAQIWDKVFRYHTFEEDAYHMLMSLVSGKRLTIN